MTLEIFVIPDSELAYQDKVFNIEGKKKGNPTSGLYFSAYICGVGAHCFFYRYSSTVSVLALNSVQEYFLLVCERKVTVENLRNFLLHNGNRTQAISVANQDTDHCISLWGSRDA